MNEEKLKTKIACLIPMNCDSCDKPLCDGEHMSVGLPCPHQIFIAHQIMRLIEEENNE
jgi:CDGSH-type Zn-finger protein